MLGTDTTYGILLATNHIHFYLLDPGVECRWESLQRLFGGVSCDYAILMATVLGAILVIILSVIIIVLIFRRRDQRFVVGQYVNNAGTSHVGHRYVSFISLSSPL